ncbi:MAG: hypothetical protein WCT16_03520 [Candidatus Buchananbacteria bacterium]
MNKKIIVTAIIFIVIFVALFIIFQGNIRNKLFKPDLQLDNITVEVIQPHTNHNLSTAELIKAKELFDKNNISEDFNKDLWIYDLKGNDNDGHVIKALQLYNGLTIFYSDLYYHFRKDGLIRYLVGDVAHVDIDSLEPKISPEEAVIKIKRKYKLELNDFSAELGFRDKYLSQGKDIQEYQLVWMITRNNKNNGGEDSADSPFLKLGGSLDETIVDAMTGKIIYYFDGIYD